MQKQKFVVLSQAKIQENRLAIISENTIDGGYTIAQQISFQDGDKSANIFLKGALHVDNLEGLYNLRDALNEAIENIE